jgi:hydrogenase maturation protease
LKTVILGVGNLILSDEGIGVHVVHEVRKWELPPGFEAHDAGTLGLLTAPLFEGADRLILIDAVYAPGEPGEVKVYSKEDIMLERLPLKLSHHQIGIQEVLSVSELRGLAPKEVILYGAIPKSFETSAELTPAGVKAKEYILKKLRILIFGLNN